MECHDADKLKSLDKLLDDKIASFDSGKDRECDRDLDAMIWELGDFENEEPPQEAEEFAEEPPIEEELVEKITVGKGGRQASLRGAGPAGVDLASAHSLGRESRKKR